MYLLFTLSDNKLCTWRNEQWGTVHVASGTYNQGINVTSSNVTIKGSDNADPSKIDRTLNLVADTNGYGVDVENQINVTIEGFNFNANPGTVAYALHSYDTTGLNLIRDNFTGGGKTALSQSSSEGYGGVDINSTDNERLAK